MAETREPSYYEIALTNNQVVVAFFILLSCVLAAFLSGVWIGRESTARAQEQLVRNTPPQQASQEGRNLDELQFFDARAKKAKKGEGGEEGAPSRQEAVAAPPASSTLLDDFNRRKNEPQPETRTPPAPPVSAPAPVVEPPAPAPARATEPVDADGLTKAERRKQRRERLLQQQQQKAAAAAAGTTASTSSKTAAKSAAEPTVPKGSYVIQVFSSSDKAQAESIRSKLTGGGQKAYLSPINRGGRTMYRVRIGPFKSRGDAQTVADKVRKGYKLDTWVTE